MVLVVDDDRDLIEMFGLMFRREHVPYISATSLAGVQALGDQLGAVRTAILDVNLGKNQPSGIDVAAWLRAQGHAITIVFITGHAPDHPLVLAAAGERGTVLEKPVSMRRLLELAKA